jgi:hypothetical protein
MAKKQTEELKDTEKIIEQEVIIEQPVQKIVKKKPYVVVLSTKNRIWYKVSEKVGNSTTPDIWNGKLKVGDTIYLEE